MVDPNIPIGAGQQYPRKSAPFSREIQDALRDVIAIKGDKGDVPAHEWNPLVATEIRFQNPDGSWGSYVDLLGGSGDAAPNVQIEYSADGLSWHPVYVPLTDIYYHFSFDNSVTWTAAISFKGEKGDTGDAGFPLYIQYSILGSIWEDSPTTPTAYVRFSTDNKVSWTAGIYVLGTNGTNGTNGIDADNVILQYSVDGVTYHTPYVVGVDKYIQFSVDNGATWLVSDRFIGIDGADGTNQYLYIAWASDDIGTDFSLTFNANLHYRAELQSQVVIATPSSGDFAGLWKYMKGTDGVAGQGAFLYIAYASDDIGSNFSLLPGVGLDYMGALNTTAYVDPVTLVAGDFTGLWRYTRGAAGVGNYYIELPYQTTLHARCEDVAAIIPVGWDIDSGDQIVNPLSSNSIDLVVYHNLGLEVVDVVVKSKTVDKQTKLIGPVAYATFEDDDTLDYLCIKSFSTTETILGIFIKFNE